jgi:uncharacterized protein
MFRLRRLTTYLITLLACLCCAGGMVAVARAAEPLPHSPSPYYIYDGAGWLGKEDFRSLDNQLKSFERETSSQIVVAIFPKLPDGAEVFDFSQRVFESWKPGQKGKDNGAIFFIFAAEHKVRIHTGRGLEGALPDARCKQIIDGTVVPLLRKQDTTGAVTEGVRAMMAAAKGEYQGNGHTQLDGKQQSNHTLGGVLVFLVILVLIVRFPGFFFQLVVNLLFNSFGSRGGGSWRGGGGGGWGGGGNDSGGFSGGGGDSGGGGAGGSW